MLILAIDSSGMTASAALLTEEKVISEMSVNNKKTHSQTLLPMIETVMAGSDLEFEAVEAIALAEGPGSFTGLRIGAALAKGLGLSLDVPLIGVSTIDALAYEAGPADALICPMIDARHETVYTGLYTWDDEGFRVLADTRVLKLQELAGLIAEMCTQGVYSRLLMTGDGADAYGDKLAAYLKEQAEVRILAETVPVHHSRQRAAAVGALALRSAAQGLTVSADEFKPRYYRMTQAERERLKEKRS